MSLSDFIAKYQGQVVGGGQCGDLIRQYWNEVLNIDPPSYPSAKDYWFNAAPPYTHTSTPQEGDIAVYNAHGAFPDGHIAIVWYNGEVFEQNADPDGSPAHLFNRANTYLLGYLTLGGDEMSVLGATEIQDLWPVLFGYAASQTDINAWTGVESNTAIRQLVATPQYAAYQQDLANLRKAAASGGMNNYNPYSGVTLYVQS